MGKLFFKPSVTGRNVGVDITLDGKVRHIEIPGSGYLPESDEVQKKLLKHPLKGHQFGFIVIPVEKLKKGKAPIFNAEISADIKNAVDGETEQEKPKKKKGKTSKGKGNAEIIVAEETEDDDGDGEITVKDVTNIQQAKEFLISQHGVDGRKIGDPEKINAKAEELGVSFPNLKQ